MFKKVTVVSSALVIIFAVALPVYAQSPSPAMPQGNQSFFGEVATFLGSMFHRQNGQGLNSGQGQTQSGPMEGGEHVSNEPSSTAMMPRPSGQPNDMTIQQYRLDVLVKQGKITSTQEQEILTELTTVQNQLKSWATANGIDPSYVIGGPMLSLQNNTQSKTPMQQSQAQPLLRYKRQGASNANGQQGGPPNASQGGFGQPPQQGQPQK